MVQQQCVVAEGDLPLTISWLLNGAVILNRPEIMVLKMGSRTSIISIESVQEYHRGNYTCVASNGSGTSRFTASLSVNGIVSASKLPQKCRFINPILHVPCTLKINIGDS